jgi:hypothetical protein
MTLELVHLCDARITLREPVTIPDTPLGTRMIFEVENATFEGERLKGSLRQHAASADWLTLAPNGVGTLDVRATIETHDGAIVFMSYRGRVDVAGGGAVYAAPLFDTGDERYLWLGKVQAISKGHLDGNVLTYEIYEAR